MSRASSHALKHPPVTAPSEPAGAPSAFPELGAVIDRERRRGRGAQSNVSGRFEAEARIAFDDGWQSLEELPPFKTTVALDTAVPVRRRRRRPRSWWTLRIGLAVLVSYAAVALLSLVWTPYDALTPGIGDGYDAPSWQFPLGTDRLGADMLSRLMVGARYNLGIVAVAVTLALTVGTILGTFAGYHGGKLDIGTLTTIVGPSGQDYDTTLEADGGGTVTASDLSSIGGADVVVEAEFETGFVEHAYIEPEAGFARRVGDTIEVQACTQSPYMDRHDIAKILGIALEKVRIIPTAVGGGFGSKLDLSV